MKLGQTWQNIPQVKSNETQVKLSTRYKKNKCVLGINSDEVHKPGLSGAAGFDEVARGEGDAAGDVGHDRGVDVFDGCLGHDAGTARQVVTPRAQNAVVAHLGRHGAHRRTAGVVHHLQVSTGPTSFVSSSYGQKPELFAFRFPRQRRRRFSIR